jgi:hypothetical protein
MNTQDIITYSIIALAVGYTIWQTVQIFFLKKKKCNCGDCSYDCTPKEVKVSGNK